MTAHNMTELAHHARAWPFEEARHLLKRIGGKVPEKGYVLFETGYGPSGLPHIGTFGEVFRTTMVKHAFETLAPDIPTRLICFSDDMDGMRKVPDNVPNKEMMQQYLGLPLTKVPDPFSNEYESFAHHNNKRLCDFLDAFGFEYEFMSSTATYQSGAFDAVLLRALENYQKIMDVMLPTLGAERQATYSPFLPISPTTGRILYVPMKATDPKAGTITFEDEDGTDVTIPVTGGNVKMQWKPDFGMRWAALGVDFEMFGKDHQANAPIYSKICRILGTEPPSQFVYELFLDDRGEKISKSKGNGIAVEDWLRYAPNESLGLYMFQKPKTAKRLYFDVIPKAVDEYVTFAQKLPGEEREKQVENPVWHIHSGHMPEIGDVPVSFNLLLNLASAANAVDKSVLWGFITRYAPDAAPEKSPFLDRLTEYAVNYYQDFVKTQKKFRAPTEKESDALTDLHAFLGELGEHPEAEEIQSGIYAIGKNYGYENLRDWFGCLYETLLGQEQGPRMGSFIALYGVAETRALIAGVLKKNLQDSAAS